jgi:hypothetical protein
VIVLSRKAPSRVRLRNIDRLIFVLAISMLSLDSECDHRGSARDRDPLASARLSRLLALEIRAGVVAARGSTARSATSSGG